MLVSEGLVDGEVGQAGGSRDGRQSARVGEQDGDVDEELFQRGDADRQMSAGASAIVSGSSERR